MKTLLLPILALLLFIFPATPGAAAEPLTVTAMSFNIRYGTAKDGENHWDKRHGLVADVFRNVDADFVGGQEAVVFQIEYLAEQLPQYKVLYRTREADPAAGEATPIFYKSARWKLDPAEQGTYWLSDTPDVPASTTWGNKLPRVATWARFIDKQTGRGIYIYNTHFDHQSQPSRERAAAQLVQRVNERKHKDEPAIVMGDLNADEKNPAIAPFRDAGFIDTFRAVHPDANPAGTFNGFKGTKTGGKIDYIFITPGAKTTAADIRYDNTNGRYPSDHFPVTATVVFP